MWLIYELFVVLGFLFYLPSAFFRRRLPHAGFGMRLGRYPASVLERIGSHETLWVHAVSVGEVLAAQPLVQALAQAYPDFPIVLSTITPGGFELANKRIAGKGAAVYFPLDLRFCVNQALDLLKPRAVFLMESELWPVFLHAASCRRIPVALVNGRISPRTYARYQRVKGWVRKRWNDVGQFLMQSQEDANRLLDLGADPRRVHVVGNLKWDASLGLRPAHEEIRQLAAQLGIAEGSPVWVAGSTHRGEERAVFEAFDAARQAHPQLQLVLAPRHLERLSEVENIARQFGLTVVRASHQVSGRSWDVALVDTFGQLPKYYALADVVFVGGSLIEHGGQNPLEATSLGKPVIFGPSMHNFSVITHQLLAHRAARQLERAAELSAVLKELLADKKSATAMGLRGQEVTEQFKGATQRTLTFIAPLLGKTRDWPQGYG